ncbi:hypothetical protein [Luteolibacter sp. Populi]|uniref:hypothetical protein n=1 Tax=Luteolibacter sp. Populi TaxID=3230487 RepID=UPI0034668C06
MNERGKFFESAFWILGGICLYWEFQVLISAVRFREIELPLFGVCTQMESIIFLLSTAWIPLLLMHIALAGFQKVAWEKKGIKGPKLPGAIGDHTIPAALEAARVGLFIVLVWGTTLLHLFLTGRAFHHFRIIPSGNVQVMVDKHFLKRSQLLGFPLRTPDNKSWDKHYWWVNAERVESSEIPVRISLPSTVTGNSGASDPKSWKNLPDEKTQEKIGAANTAPAIVSPAQDKRDEIVYIDQFDKAYERTRVSALPFQPLLFLLEALGLFALTIIASINARRPWDPFTPTWNWMKTRPRAILVLFGHRSPPSPPIQTP